MQETVIPVPRKDTGGERRWDLPTWF